MTPDIDDIYMTRDIDVELDKDARHSCTLDITASPLGHFIDLPFCRQLREDLIIDAAQFKGQGKLTALVSANVNVLSALRCFRNLPACW